MKERDGMETFAKDCPLCGSASHKAIYAGVGVRLCSNDECNCVFGPFWRLMNLFPFNGWFMVYEGSYWRALWHWLTTPLEEE